MCAQGCNSGLIDFPSLKVATAWLGREWQQNTTGHCAPATAQVEAERAKLGEEAAAAQKEAAAAKERLVAVEAASTEAQVSRGLQQAGCTPGLAAYILMPVSPGWRCKRIAALHHPCF
jgi:hypothetical protein